MSYGTNGDDEEARTPLVPRSDKNNDNKKNRSGLLWNRFMILLLLVVVVCASVYFELQIVSLKQLVSTEEAKIQDLSGVVAAQQGVIKRFNNSVSNSDVLSRLHSLETDMDRKSQDLEKDLEDTKASINLQLNQTIHDLDNMISDAKQTIQDDVQTVKENVNQYVITTQAQFSMENSFMIYQVAGTFMVLSALISMFHMTNHLRRMNEAIIQRKVLAILWMSPIYAITSWFSLVFVSAEGYLAIIKDGYEAYVIYQFLSFCISVLGKGDRRTVVELLSRRADHLSPPFELLGICRNATVQKMLCCCCNNNKKKNDDGDDDDDDDDDNNNAGCCQKCMRDPYENMDPYKLADAVLLQCQFFAMQFVFLRPLVTIVTFTLNKLEYYGPVATGPRDYRAPQVYLSIIQNLSVFTAFTGLLKFYHAVDKDLAWCRPFAKFLCVKGVVFMTFWQGLAITVAAEVTDVGGEDPDEWASSAQNFLICLEMLLFSIAHFYCFPVDEWEEGYKAQHSKQQFGDSLALGDFVQDLKLIMRANKKVRKSKRLSQQPTVLEEDEEEGDEKDKESFVVDDDDDDDTTGGDTASVASGSVVDDEYVLKKIEQTLMTDDSNDDDEVMEAKKRLLSHDVFEGEESGSHNDDLNDDEALRPPPPTSLPPPPPSESTGLLSSYQSGGDAGTNDAEDDSYKPIFGVKDYNNTGK